MRDTEPQLDAGPILQTAFGFWSSKVLLTAAKLGVFTKLGDRRLAGAELGSELGLHPRGISDFLDALVAMKFLGRDGDGPSAKYSNTPASALYLDQSSPRYIGGLLVMLNDRLFKYWHGLPEGLRTGRPQNETKHGQKGIFEELYQGLPKLEQFMGAMTGLSRINFEAFAARFDFSKYKTSATSAERPACSAWRPRSDILIFSAYPSICRLWSRSQKNTSPPRGSATASAPPPAISSKIRCPKPTSSRWA